MTLDAAFVISLIVLAIFFFGRWRDVIAFLTLIAVATLLFGGGNAP